MNKVFKNKQVKMVEGDYKGQAGLFKAITGYTDGYGAVCKIKIDNKILEFTSDFFVFMDDAMQLAWENDDEFEIDD